MNIGTLLQCMRHTWAMTQSRIGGNMCMKPAAMSPILQFPEERKAWFCRRCSKRLTASPGAASEVPPGHALGARRVLRLYAAVNAERDQPLTSTPMRSNKMICAVVHPPPTSFAWKPEADEVARPSYFQPATPALMMTGYYEYNQFDSDNIWNASAVFSSNYQIINNPLFDEV